MNVLAIPDSPIGRVGANVSHPLLLRGEFLQISDLLVVPLDRRGQIVGRQLPECQIEGRARSGKTGRFAQK